MNRKLILVMCLVIMSCLIPLSSMNTGATDFYDRYAYANANTNYNSQAGTTGTWKVNLNFTDKMIINFSGAANRCFIIYDFTTSYYGSTWLSVGTLYPGGFGYNVQSDVSTCLAGGYTTDNQFIFRAPYTGMYPIRAITSNGNAFTWNYTINSTTSLTALDDKINSLNQTINNLNHNLQTVEGNMTTISTEINSILNQINILKVQVTNNSNNITQLQNIINLLQTQVEKLKADVNSINATNITNIIQTTNLTKINQSLVDLTITLNDLNRTVQNLDIPPNLQSDVIKLQIENAQLKKNLTEIQKQVDGFKPSVNKTIYNNNTVTKRVTEGLSAQMALELAIGVIMGGGAIGGIAGSIASRKRKEEPPESSQPPREIRRAQAAPMKSPDTSISEEPPILKTEDTTPEKEDNLDEVMTKLKGPEKEKLKDKSAMGEVDAVPIIAKESDRLAKKIRIGKTDYTESQIMSRLSSLPRGLPSEFFGIDPSELASILMIQKYIRNDEGDIIFQYEKKWYFGDPAKAGIYMQRVDRAK
jgi:hypothetical protein